MQERLGASAVGDLLREWRAARGVSQLDLALSAGVSSRHVSFMETGRSQPSRGMVLRLAETLELPLRDRNALLVAAGFAPVFGESRLDEESVRPVRRALEMILERHEPYPAFVLNPSWDILMSNRAHESMLAWMLPHGVAPANPVNVLDLVLDPRLLRPMIRNWDLVAHVLARRVQRQLRVPEPSPGVRDLYERLTAFPGVVDAMKSVRAPTESSVMIPMTFDLPGVSLSFFSTIAVIGTPQDITLEELRIESLFPANAETEHALARLRSITHSKKTSPHR